MNKTIIKWKNIYHTVGTVPTFNRKIVEICNFDIPNTHINDPPWPILGEKKILTKENQAA
jgi:hypothetical protein